MEKPVFFASAKEASLPPPCKYLGNIPAIRVYPLWILSRCHCFCYTFSITSRCFPPTQLRKKEKKKKQSLCGAIKGPIYCIWKLLCQRQSLQSLRRPCTCLISIIMICWPSPVITHLMVTWVLMGSSPSPHPNLPSYKVRKKGIPSRKHRRKVPCEQHLNTLLVVLRLLFFSDLPLMQNIKTIQKSLIKNYSQI